MKKVSVIVPVYNTYRYLKRCLNSLVNQTLNDIEIIVINDCSTDESKKVLDEYEKKYNNILVFHNKTNKGIGYNRNLGIKKASGEYISFIDSDDFVDETMYDKMYKKAKENALDLVICKFHKMFEKKDDLIEIEPDFKIPYFKNTNLKNSPNLLLDINLAPWNKLYKKELLEDIRFPENLKYEDAIVVVKALARAKKIGMVDEMLNYYLVRSKSETTSMDKRVFDIIAITKEIIEELKNQDYYDDIKKYVEAMTIRNLFRYTIQQKNQKDKKLANEFIDDVFMFLNKEFPNWKQNTIWKRRNVFKRMIEQNEILTKIYCSLF